MASKPLVAFFFTYPTVRQRLHKLNAQKITLPSSFVSIVITTNIHKNRQPIEWSRKADRHEIDRVYRSPSIASSLRFSLTI